MNELAIKRCDKHMLSTYINFLFLSRFLVDNNFNERTGLVEIRIFLSLI